MIGASRARAHEARRAPHQRVAAAPSSKIDALAAAISEGRVGGAAVDVYPEEPESNSDGFASELRGLPNVILTPHIGGSTEEAQEAIGREVATSLIKFTNTGTTTGSVNFPAVESPQARGTHRILNVHKNVPGVLRDVNRDRLRARREHPHPGPRDRRRTSATS